VFIEVNTVDSFSKQLNVNGRLGIFFAPTCKHAMAQNHFIGVLAIGANKFYIDALLLSQKHIGANFALIPSFST